MNVNDYVIIILGRACMLHVRVLRSSLALPGHWQCILALLAVKMAEEGGEERLRLSIKTTKDKIDVEVPPDYTAKQVDPARAVASPVPAAEQYTPVYCVDSPSTSLAAC